MIVNQGPAIQRQLCATLREIRTKRDLTQKEVAAALDWSAAKLMRIENGAVRVSVTDLKALLAHYGVDDQQRVEELVKMAQAVKAMSWSEYKGLLLPDFIRYLSYESTAERVCNFQPLLLPGMLQTEAYARATIRGLSASDLDEDTVERLVQARIRRQELLSVESRPTMIFIIDEGVIRRQVGEGDLMTRQLEHLKEAAHNPKVEIRIVPHSAGVHPGLLGSFVVLEFADPAEDLVYIEDARAELTPRDWQRDVAAYKTDFATLESVATSAAQLHETIDRVMAQLTSSGGT